MMVNDYTRKTGYFTDFPFALDVEVVTACLALGSRLRVAAADQG